MKIGYGQFSPEFGDRKANIHRTVSIVEAAKADLIVLPELCTTGYNFTSRGELAILAEEVPDGPSCTAWSACARKTGTTIVAGIAEKAGDSLFNSCVLITGDGVRATYRKVHLFFRENRIFSPGREFPVVEIDGVNIGLMICFDWAFPEAARTLALAGADIICHPSNLVLHLCQDAMVTRCIENRLFAVTANRYGTEDRGGLSLTFSGASQITAPDGQRLAVATKAEDTIAVVEIDPADARNKMITEFNHVIDDRRPGAYGL